MDKFNLLKNSVEDFNKTSNFTFESVMEEDRKHCHIDQRYYLMKLKMGAFHDEIHNMKSSQHQLQTLTSHLTTLCEKQTELANMVHFGILKQTNSGFWKIVEDEFHSKIQNDR